MVIHPGKSGRPSPGRRKRLAARRALLVVLSLLPGPFAQAAPPPDDPPGQCREAAGFTTRDALDIINIDPPAAIALCRKALQARPDDARLLAYLGRALYKAGQMPESHALIARAADQASPLGQALMGVLYEQGYGVPADLRQAADWYRLAAQAGNPLAQYNLAMLLLSGRGVSTDAALAVRLIQMSAKQGDAEAQFKLGQLYEEGLGVNPDPKQARAWYDKAAQQGHGGALAWKLMDSVRKFAQPYADPPPEPPAPPVIPLNLPDNQG